MNEKLKTLIVTTGAGVISAGINLVEKMPKVGVTLTVIGALLMGGGIYLVIKQFYEKIRRIENALRNFEA